MAFRFSLLPKWCISNKNPGFYDTESASAIEQTAKLHKTMQELIEDYNAFADEMNAKIIEFIDGSEQDQEEFAVGLRQEFQDFIDTIDLKLKDIELSFNYSEANLEKQYTLFMAEARSALDSFKQDVERIRETIKAQTKEEISTIIDEMEATGEINEILGDSISHFHERVSEIESDIEGIKYGEITTEDYYLRRLVNELLPTLGKLTIVHGPAAVTNMAIYYDPSLFIRANTSIDGKFYDANSDESVKNSRTYFELKEIEYNEDGAITNAPAGLADMLVRQMNSFSMGRYSHFAHTANWDSVLCFTYNEGDSVFGKGGYWRLYVWWLNRVQHDLYKEGAITVDECTEWGRNDISPHLYGVDVRFY